MLLLGCRWIIFCLLLIKIGLLFRVLVVILDVWIISGIVYVWVIMVVWLLIDFFFRIIFLSVLLYFSSLFGLILWVIRMGLFGIFVLVFLF